MASVHKKGNQWFGVVSLPDGKLKWLSFRDPETRVRITDKKIVLEMSEAWLKAYLDAHALPDQDIKGRQAIVLHLCRHLCACLRIPEPGERVGQGPEFQPFAEEWLARVEPEIKLPTVRLYKTCISKFTKHLTALGKTTMGAFSVEDAQRYYDSLFAKELLSTATAKNRVGPLSSIYQHAVDFDLISKNPFSGLRMRKKVNEERLPFSDQDEAKIFRTIQGTEWETLCMIARWTGLRLSDAQHARWEWISDENDCMVLTWAPEKQRRNAKLIRSVAAFGPLRQHLLPKRKKAGPILPELHDRNTDGDGGLSLEFSELLDKAGVNRMPVEKQGRKQYRKGFHSWRHTFNTWLEKIGVDPATRAKITGHADTKTNQIYSHASAAELAAVVTRMNGEAKSVTAKSG